MGTGTGSGTGGVRGWWRALWSRLLRESGPAPRPSRWAWAADGALAAGLAVCNLYSVLSADTGDASRKVFVGGGPLVRAPEAPVPSPPAKLVEVHHQALSAGAVVAALLAALPLVARRRYPLAAFWVVVAAALLSKGGTGINGTAMVVSCLVAAYSVAMYSPYRALAVTSLVAGGALIAGFKHDSLPSANSGLMPLLLLLPLGLVANAVHTWRQRAQHLEADRKAAATLATERERARIARELHDVVTHSVTVMVVQAGAARTVLDASPDQAREAMRAVEGGGRAALAELRHAMGLLTMPADQATGPGGGTPAGGGGSAGQDGPGDDRPGPAG